MALFSSVKALTGGGGDCKGLMPAMQGSRERSTAKYDKGNIRSSIESESRAGDVHRNGWVFRASLGPGGSGKAT
ncbi:hypothetical protein ABEF95_000007, partial [Exophiala dermatitidis]